MKWIPVESKNLSAIGYNAATNTGGAKFHAGGTWEYPNMSPEVFDAWENSSSKGAYFAANIKDKYPGRRVGVSVKEAF